MIRWTTHILQQIAVSRVSHRFAVFAIFLVGLAAYRLMRAFPAMKVVSAGPPAQLVWESNATEQATGPRKRFQDVQFSYEGKHKGELGVPVSCKVNVFYGRWRRFDQGQGQGPVR